MKNWISLSTAAAIVIAFLAIRPGYSDDSPKKETKSTAKNTTADSAAAKSKPTAKKKPKGRLPNYYAQIGISSQQRADIYAIQAKYGEQLAELKKQMAALVAKRDTEVQAVLTDAQRAELVKAREESKKRALERTKEAAAARAKQKTAKTTKSE